jgi:uncharacterized protein YbaR (Trm112 family)
MRNFFYQECPVCGRHLRIRIEHLGKELACSHCQGAFTARDPEMPEMVPEEAQFDSLSFDGLTLSQQPVHVHIPR